MIGSQPVTLCVSPVKPRHCKNVPEKKKKKKSSKTLHMTSSNVIRRLFATQAITTFAQENAFERRR